MYFDIGRDVQSPSDESGALLQFSNAQSTVCSNSTQNANDTFRALADNDELQSGGWNRSARNEAVWICGDSMLLWFGLFRSF